VPSISGRVVNVFGLILVIKTRLLPSVIAASAPVARHKQRA
jgi:hypothetical protein